MASSRAARFSPPSVTLAAAASPPASLPSERRRRCKEQGYEGRGGLPGEMECRCGAPTGQRHIWQHPPALLPLLAADPHLRTLWPPTSTNSPPRSHKNLLHVLHQKVLLLGVHKHDAAHLDVAGREGSAERKGQLSG